MARYKAKGKNDYYEIKDLYTMISLLKGYDEVKNFFKDLLTTSEKIMLTRRIKIAKELLKGMGYEEIRGKFGVGFSTINHVDKSICAGLDGYRTAIKKSNKHNKNIKRIREYDNMPNIIPGLRKTNPVGYFIMKLLSDGDK